MKILWYNNKVIAYFDTSTLPKGMKLIDLRNKYVVYKISFFNTKKVYYGQTSDFGDRVYCHIKDSRGKNKRLYNNIRNCGHCIFSIIEVCESKEEARKIESRLIKEERNKIIKENAKEYYLLSESEKKNFLIEHSYNINK